MMDEPIEQYKSAKKLKLKNLKKEFPKVFKKINCPSCENEVAADNVNLQNSIAKCSSCNVIFSIQEEVDNIKTKKEIKQQTLRPEGIDLFYYRDELDITIQQHIQGFDLWAISFSPLIAFSLIAFYYLEEFTIPLYIPIIFSLLAFYFIYKAFNYSNYKTYIDVNNSSLSIKHRPKNFRKDKMYAADEIEQLYLKPSNESGGHYTINLIINGLEGQKHEKLMTVNSLSKAKYLEQEIEQYLNIIDREVPEASI